MSALPALRQLLNENPHLWVQAGNIAAHAREVWIRMISGENFVLYESLIRDSYAMVNDLVSDGAPRMERLLAERVVMCRLQVYHADIALASAGRDVSAKAAAILDKRIADCQSRLGQAIKDLADYQKRLGRPPVSSAAGASQKPAVDITPPMTSVPSATASPRSEKLTPPAARQSPAAPSSSAIVPQIDPASLDMSDEAIEARIRAEWDMIHGLNNESADQKPRNGHNGYTNRLKGLLVPTPHE